MKTDWEKHLERRTKNLGFISRLGSFKDLTPAEKDSALAVETKAWQESKGNKTFTISAEYSTPLGHGFNLKTNINYADGMKFKDAVSVYMHTPIDKDGILREQGINVYPYENPPNKLQKMLNKIKLKTAEDPGWWPEFVVNVTPLLVLAAILYMFYKFGLL